MVHWIVLDHKDFMNRLHGTVRVERFSRMQLSKIADVERKKPIGNVSVTQRMESGGRGNYDLAFSKVIFC